MMQASNFIKTSFEVGRDFFREPLRVAVVELSRGGRKLISPRFYYPWGQGVRAFIFRMYVYTPIFYNSKLPNLDLNLHGTRSDLS